MTREEILAIRATGLALVAQCDAALARVDSTPLLAVESNASNGARECEHPATHVIDTSVSSAPYRAKCTKCGATVERVTA